MGQCDNTSLTCPNIPIMLPSTSYMATLQSEEAEITRTRSFLSHISSVLIMSEWAWNWHFMAETQNQSTESTSCPRETHRIKVLKVCHVLRKYTESKYLYVVSVVSSFILTWSGGYDVVWGLYTVLWDVPHFDHSIHISRRHVAVLLVCRHQNTASCTVNKMNLSS